MEQRISDRRLASLDAIVGCPRFGLLRGRIIDIGRGGLYVRAETSLVPLGARVTVTFQPGEGVCNTCLSIDGRVVHQSLHGFGVEFGPLEAHCHAALERLLPMMPPLLGTPMRELRAI